MKIVCDACQAKYSISDDKVQGKVFKIRCKKCSNIIVVRGGAAAAEPAPAPAQEKDTRVYDYGYEGGQQPAADESVWHVVINQDQVGPMTAAEVQQRFNAGEIDAETYAWREGFPDWLPLAQVDAFAGFAMAGTSTSAATATHSSGQDAVAAMFGGASSTEEVGTVRSDPGDLFASASASARHSADDDGGDLFGSKPAASAAAQQAASAKLRGERNENSVLFSLNNLAQLASDKPASAAAAPVASTMPGHASGAAGGEGSGLIDIRSMANAYLGGPGAAKPATSSAIGSIDDLPVFGGGGFSEPAVIVPTARPSGPSSKMIYALIGSVALLAIVGVILLVVVLKKGDKEPAKEVAAVGDTMKKPDEAKPDDKKPDDTKKPDDAKPDETAAKKPDETAAKKPDEAAAKKPDETAKKPDEAKKPPVTVKKDTSSRPLVAVNTAPKKDTTKDTTKKDPVAKDPPKSGDCDEVSCLLNNNEGACCAKFRKGGAPKKDQPSVQIGEKPKSDVPEGLDRAMISAGVAAVKGRAVACGSQSSKKGTVKVSVKVSPDGSVAGVTVKESPDPALGSCVQAAMQRAHFQKTQNGGSFGYPFVF